MITIRKKKDDQGFIVEGHAEYNPGNDIVCSAVSAITQTAFLGLRKYSTAEAIQDESGGYFNVIIDNHSVQTLVIMDAMFLGLIALAEEYPEYVKVQEEG